MRRDVGPAPTETGDTEGLALYTLDESGAVVFRGWIRRRGSKWSDAYDHLYPYVVGGRDVRVTLPPSRSHNGGFDKHGNLWQASAKWRILP
jgi:hypothetical protein